MINYEIRKACEEDLPGINDMMISLINESESISDGELQHMISFQENISFLHQLLSNNDSLLLVAADSTVLHGFLSAFEKPVPEGCPFFRTTRRLEIENIYVKPELRKNGIAHSMLQYAEIWAKENSFDSIELEVYNKNENAKSLYDDLDYKVAKEKRRKILQ